MLRSISLVLSLLLLSPALGSADLHGFDVHDLLAMKRISSMAVDSKGERVVFVLRTTDLEENRGRSDLWMVDVDSGELQRLTTDPASDHSPAWSPDGESLYFLSSRSGSSQVWRLPLSGGEARPVTGLPLEVTSFRLSNDGGRLAVSVDVFIDAETMQETSDRLEADAPASGVVYDDIFVRHWDQWKDGRRSHVFVASLEKGELASEFGDVMKGMDADCPTKPFGGVGDYVFAPDGGGVVFTARDVGGTEPWSTDFDLYYTPVGAPVGGTTTPLCITDVNQAWDSNPVFSPDGRRLAYLAMEEPGYEADRRVVVVRSWNADGDGLFGPPQPLTQGWDRSPSSLSWAPGGRSLLAHASNLGRRSLFRIDARDGETELLVSGGSVSAEAEVDGRLFYAASSFSSPTELFVARRNGSREERLTRINEARLAAVSMGGAEQFQFTGANGDTVYGWLVKPADFDPEQSYPVAFLIHGGPQGSFGTNFHYRWNPQVYAGRGYAAVMIDFHGSAGYGEDFKDSIQANWGGWPLEDLQKGLAFALDEYPWLDGERVAGLGASYGGYMVNWIAGNWPDRFRCLVNHDGLFDTRFAYYATEELWFPERDFAGTPWSNPETYEKWNPANFVDRWKTPMLVVHGELDYRVPPIHGLAAFNALQRRGVPSRLLYYPDENHWVLSPQNSIQWHEEVLEWLDRWTDSSGAR